MEKILLSFDEEGYTRVLNRKVLTVYQTQQAVDAINSLSSAKVDQTLLEELLYVSSGQKLRGAITVAVTTELNKAGISSPSLREATVNGDLDRLQQILDGFTLHVPELRDQLTLDEQGRVVFQDEEDPQTLREQFSTYVETPKGIQAYQAHKQMIESVNELLRLCPSLSLFALDKLYSMDLEKGVLIQKNLEYDRITQN